MVQMNENYKRLQSSYLFSDIARKVQEFQESHRDIEVIKMGIGDVTEPLAPSIIEALHGAVDDLSVAERFYGYGPEQGYSFLREVIAKNDYQERGVDISADEIFVSDGAKGDTGNFQELFSSSTRIAMPDPVYPVYLDTNVMAGRSGEIKEGRFEEITFLDSHAENDFIPMPDDLAGERVDVIYLCFPNNPTGAVATKKQLERWVSYARENRALILFDAAYESFIRDPDLPRSIFEIEGAKEVSVEFRSFSKKSGFTGLRCGFTTIPKECRLFDQSGASQLLAPLWNRRQTTKFNGASYLSQRGAEAVYSESGKIEVQKTLDYYHENAKIISHSLTQAGIVHSGGTNAPYVWMKVKGSSWEGFDTILEKTGVVTTPGSGFGRCGEGYIRLSSFNSRESIEEAMRRLTPQFLREL